MKLRSYNKSGFTLMELLVVVFIIGLISTILIVNWKKNERQYQLQRTAQELVQNIRKVQDMALNSYRYDQNKPLPLNYGIHFDKQLVSSYKIFADKNNNNKYNSNEELEVINIETGIEIDSLSAEPNLDILFSLPDAFTLINPSAVSATITIKKSDGSLSKTIVVRNTGQISIE